MFDIIQSFPLGSRQTVCKFLSMSSMQTANRLLSWPMCCHLVLTTALRLIQLEWLLGVAAFLQLIAEHIDRSAELFDLRPHSNPQSLSSACRPSPLAHTTASFIDRRPPSSPTVSVISLPPITTCPNRTASFCLNGERTEDEVDMNT